MIFYVRDGDRKVATVDIGKTEGVELLLFITEHLEVVNETPFVEALMIALEEALEG